MTPPETVTSLKPPEFSVDLAWYFGCVASISAFAAIASLFGDAKKQVTFRVFFAYVFAGVVAGLSIVFVMSITLGFSWFALGVAGFAGFKALEIMLLGYSLVRSLVSKVMGRKSLDKDEADSDSPSAT